MYCQIPAMYKFIYKIEESIFIRDGVIPNLLNDNFLIIPA